MQIFALYFLLPSITLVAQVYPMLLTIYCKKGKGKTTEEVPWGKKKKKKICYNNFVPVLKPVFGVQDFGFYSAKHLRICLIPVVSVRLKHVFRHFTE